ncbi:MAG TPA: substrate-binding domain-containing protein [Ktedonobacteraceae bacterium]|jgi:serine/threonine protein kinase
MAELTGVMVGHYFLLQCLDRQGMVESYLARPTNSAGPDVRLRLFRPPFPDPGAFQEHFATEVRKLWRCQHAHIQPLIEYGEGDDVLYTVCKDDGTPTLQQLLASGREALPLSLVATLITRTCQALQYAHEQGIVHGNLQPSSILVGPDGQVRLTDFSCKRAYQEGEPALAQVEEGNPAYIAPEQAVGMLTPASDIYALGVLLYRLLGGELPYRGQNAGEIALEHACEPLPSLRALRPDLAESLELVVRAAMAKTVHARFHSAHELATAFMLALATDRPLAVPTIRRTAGVARRPGLTRARILSLLAILLLILGLSSTLSLLSFSPLPFALGPGLPGHLLHAPAPFPGLFPKLAAPTPADAQPASGHASAPRQTPTVSPATATVPVPVPTSTTPAPPLACAPGPLSIDGSFYLAPLLRQIGRDYQAHCPGLSLTVANRGCRVGLKALENRQIDLAASDLSARTTYPLSDHPVAALLAAVIVSPDVQISALSHQQLQAIYQGRVSSWAQVGGPAETIKVLLHPTTDPLKAIFQTFVLNGSAEHVSGSKLSKTLAAAAIVQQTASTPGAITYVPLAAVHTAGVRVLAIDQVLPGAPGVQMGTYPFWGIAHLYTWPGASAQAQAYVQFLQSAPEANRLIRAGALPLAQLPPAVLISHLPGPFINV